jgi:hypothetical protein
MSPDQIAALPAIVSIIEKIGNWPIGLILIIMLLCIGIGPYVFQWFNSRSMEKRQEAVTKMFEATQQMYKDNVVLVENYAKMSAEHVDTIRLSTAATQDLTTFLKTRTPCHQFINANLVATMHRAKDPQ